MNAPHFPATSKYIHNHLISFRTKTKRNMRMVITNCVIFCFSEIFYPADVRQQKTSAKSLKACVRSFFFWRRGSTWHVWRSDTQGSEVIFYKMCRECAHDSIWRMSVFVCLLERRREPRENVCFLRVKLTTSEFSSS